jgi:hypothetical protein
MTECVTWNFVNWGSPILIGSAKLSFEKTVTAGRMTQDQSWRPRLLMSRRSAL